MGSRGPIAKGGKTRAKSLKGADGKRLRRRPADADAIARRLARDIAGLTDADVALVEDMARWVAISMEAFRQLREPLAGQPQLQQGQAEDAAIEAVLALLMTDTAHGNKDESRKSPLLIVMRTASEQIRANAQQLGATPAARRHRERQRRRISSRGHCSDRHSHRRRPLPAWRHQQQPEASRQHTQRKHRQRAQPGQHRHEDISLNIVIHRGHPISASEIGS